MMNRRSRLGSVVFKCQPREGKVMDVNIRGWKVTNTRITRRVTDDNMTAMGRTSSIRDNTWVLFKRKLSGKGAKGLGFQLGVFTRTIGCGAYTLHAKCNKAEVNRTSRVSSKRTGVSSSALTWRHSVVIPQYLGTSVVISVLAYCPRHLLRRDRCKTLLTNLH